VYQGFDDRNSFKRDSFEGEIGDLDKDSRNDVVSSLGGWEVNETDLIKINKK